MSDALLSWAVPLAIALHNLEEGTWLLAWSEERTGAEGAPPLAGPALRLSMQEADSWFDD